MRARAAAVSVLIAAALVGCGGAGGTTSTPASGGKSGSANAVTIQNFAFAPKNLTVATGTTVTWTNADQSTHTVSADDKSFDAGNIVPGRSFTFQFQRAGTYAYHCNIHQYMQATITVSG